MRQTILLSLVLAAIFAGSAAAEPPRRVVSMNVCTDQLAMLVAGPGQLVSVSELARDPASSAMAEEAEKYPVNHGLAEEVLLLEPDLVIVGTYTTRATVSLLENLGFRVEQFAPASSIQDIRAHIRRMGRLLGHTERAEALIESFDARLRQARRFSGNDPVAAPYYANGYSSGAGTLAAAVIEAAGYQDLGTRLGIAGIEYMPVEIMVMQDPDLLVLETRDYEAPARAQEIFSHPALRQAFAETDRVSVANRLWVCGGPFTASAVETLAAHRREFGPGER